MKENYKIRKSTQDDIPKLLALYANAREMMKKNGNPNQWLTYPNEALLRSDAESGIGYVITAGEEIVGTFVFFVGDDPTYAVIDGEWLNSEEYGVIHRIAADGVHGGTVTAATEFALGKTNNVRIDTHPDNKVMQHVLEKNGYVRCGNITVPDDFSPASPRFAYHLAVKK